MKEIKLYSNYQETEFLSRPNRFVMELKLNGKTIRAYVPNTGRMKEFLTPVRKFYVSKQKMPKYEYKVIGTEYQGEYVFLDTIKVNRIFQEILQERIIKDFSNYQEMKREVTFGRSRFDFFLTFPKGNRKIIEVKSCTLCHNGTAMFPDAPTARGQKHLIHLNDLAAEDLESWAVFLITGPQAKRFLPNLHIDPDFSRSFLECKKVKHKALKLKFSDPVTLLPEQTEMVPIDLDHLSGNLRNSGTYLLVLYNSTGFEMQIGALGTRKFPAGYYVYVGSALKNLEQRLKRHRSARKKIHWHIDYITPKEMKVEKIHVVRGVDRLENSIARAFSIICDNSIQGFGATDSDLDSHLFYFRSNPESREGFQNIILDYRSL